MPFTNVLDQSIVTHAFGGAAWTADSAYYVALSTTTPTQAKGSGAPWSFTEPSAQTALTSALASGTAYTSLAVQPLSSAVASGDSIKVTTGSNTQTFTASAAATAGATSISVTSLVANAAYAVGSLVQDITKGGGYSRVKVTNNATDFVAATPQPATGYGVTNGAAITFGSPTGSWGTVTYFGLFSATGGGTLVAYGALTTAKAVGAGDTAPSFAIHALTIANS